MTELEKRPLPPREGSSRQSHFGLIMSLLVGTGAVAVAVPVWKEMSRQVHARIEMEVATRVYEAGQENRRAGFLDAVCAAKRAGILNLEVRQRARVEATGSYSSDAQTADHEIEMAASECRRVAD